MVLQDLNIDTVTFVATHMRAWDRREIFATRFDGELEPFIQDVMRAGPVSWVAGDGLPIAAFGCRPLWPGVWSMWFFATDEISKIGLSVTRLIIKGILPMLWDAGAHRLECRSMDGHTEAQEWLETLGARREGTAKAYGRDGEDFHVYVWGRP